MIASKLRLPDAPRPIRTGHLPFDGRSPAGHRLSVNGSHLLVNGRPRFAISGELHYSRLDRRSWGDELLKLKMGGVDVVSTYVFWNHHEEIEGRFEWTGNKDLRWFLELCGRHGLWAIIRIGPWCHGEARNGGFPDWLHGRPFELRTDDPGYLACVRRLYREIGAQVAGLLFKDGGPVIGTQLENELLHSAAPWEMTAGTTGEWVPPGRDGEAHIRTLKRLAQEAGIDTPLWTCTAWGGAAAPVPEVLPLWGGYAYRPWIFFQGDHVAGVQKPPPPGSSEDPHPPTLEYLFQDRHRDGAPRTNGFEPRYLPEDVPYACCEMGGGMQVYYCYRFQLPPASVEAMAVVQAASGCNWLGYYMFHGGTNPTGKTIPFLNENLAPKISYDYQAPLGEFGQVRDHYHRLRALHLFLRSFEDRICETETVLPAGASFLDPRDVETVRWAVRARGSSGFLFLCNFQDHVRTRDHEGVAFLVESAGETIRIPAEGGLRLERDVSCVLPFRFDLDGLSLRSAVAQPLTRLEGPEGPLHVFMTPQGMEGEFCFEADAVRSIEPSSLETREVAPGLLVVRTGREGAAFQVTCADGNVRTICALSRADGLRLWRARLRGVDHLLVTDATVLSDEPAAPGFRLELEGQGEVSLRAWPPLPADVRVEGANLARGGRAGLFTEYRLSPDPVTPPTFGLERIGARKAVLRFGPESFTGWKRVLLRIGYAGDTACAYVDGRLVADDYSNGAPWDIELTRRADELATRVMYLDVIPLRKDARAVRDGAMAGQQLLAGEELGEIRSVEAVGVREIGIR